MQYKYSSQDVVFSENVHIHVGHVVLLGELCENGLKTVYDLQEFRIIVPDFPLFFGVSNEAAPVSGGWAARVFALLTT